MYSMADWLNAWNSNQLTEVKKSSLSWGNFLAMRKIGKSIGLIVCFLLARVRLKGLETWDVHIDLGEGNTVFVF
ncbi:hypothetical protein CEXT_69751 [Caerostris extrusa]|uniref:Uncharacterized protein n=1 Tax=Caerostris extrusa TaxID=172846 RepID=A0AAV4XK67_CAEEX|nr:hypothetical protein CEXT_69751 [Caerostris extrusa]